MRRHIRTSSYIPDDAEEIDVGVVDGKVDDDAARAAVDPTVVHQVLNDRRRLAGVEDEVLDVAAAAVRGDHSLEGRTLQLFRRLVSPAVRVDRAIIYTLVISNILYLHCLQLHFQTLHCQVRLRNGTRATPRGWPCK